MIWIYVLVTIYFIIGVAFSVLNMVGHYQQNPKSTDLQLLLVFIIGFVFWPYVWIKSTQ